MKQDQYLPEKYVMKIYASMDEEVESDFFQTKEMGSVAMREFMKLVEDFCDEMEWEGSSMFDEHLDYNKIQYWSSQLKKKIINMPEEGELMAMILLMEIHSRRRRYFRRKNLF